MNQCQYVKTTCELAEDKFANGYCTGSACPTFICYCKEHDGEPEVTAAQAEVARFEAWD